MVEASLNYLAPMSERPRYYLSKPPEGQPWRNTRGDRRSVSIADARELSEAPNLDREGFTLVSHETQVGELFDAELVRAQFYPEVEQLVAKTVGAARVVAFDHNVRSGEKAARGEAGAQTPVKFAHNDYTLDSAPQRVRDLLGEEAPALLVHRFSVINFWKPIRGPVQESPLAFCDARTIDADELAKTDLVYADRVGEVYSLTFSERHRWYYYSAMQANEVLLLKCYDSDPRFARFTAHSAFDDPTSAGDAPSRESIEVRTLAFYAS